MGGSAELQKGFIGREDHEKLQNALEQLVDAHIFIDDSAGVTLAEMRAKARRLKQNAGASTWWWWTICN